MEPKRKQQLLKQTSPQFLYKKAKKIQRTFFVELSNPNRKVSLKLKQQDN